MAFQAKTIADIHYLTHIGYISHDPDNAHQQK